MIFSPSKKTSIRACSEYDPELVLTCIRTVMNDVPPPDVTGKTVLLKPNILSPKKPEFAICTHPVVVAACVKVFLERGAKRVLVGESPAVSPSLIAAKACGMYDAVVASGGEWVDFSDAVTVPCPEGSLVKSFEFASPFTQADIVVSLSKLKSHQLMAYTGAMKNLFGLVIGLKKAQMHYRFSDKKDFARYLTDLNIASDAHYSVMDAIVGMEGPGGPGNGDPVSLGFIAASDNILALDWTCASLVGYNPHDILNLEDALQRKRWLSDPEEIELCGETPESLGPLKFKIVSETSGLTNLQKILPSWVNVLAKTVFVKTPRFRHTICTRCGRCIEICPAHILSFEKDAKSKTGKKVVIKKSDCLHCFCCHEICPSDAIELRRF